MTRFQPVPATRSAPLLLVVEEDIALRHSIAQALQARNYRVALARSVSEALEMIDDLRFIDVEVDGLLVGYRLKDGPGFSVIKEFRREFPNAVAAIITGEEDISTAVWTRAHGVVHVDNPAEWAELRPWLEQIKVPA